MSFALGAPLAVGNEVHVGGAGGEQEGRIDVGIARPGPEVERLGAGRPHELALVDLVAALHANRREERMAGPDAVAVENDDVQRAAYLAGEDHLTVGRRLDLDARAGGVVEASVAGAVLGGRGPERISDGCRYRRLVPACGGRRCGARHSDDEQSDDAESQNGKAHWLPPRSERRAGEAPPPTLQLGV